MKGRLISAFIAGAMPVLLAGCQQAPAQPILTKEAFFAAAVQCDAKDPLFTSRLNGELPSFSYLETNSPGPTASPTSQCLADRLKGYRFQSMEIRSEPPKGTAQ